MRRAWAAVALVAAACSSGGATQVPTGESPTTTTTTEPVGDLDYLALLDLTDGMTNIAVTLGDEKAVEFGEGVCADLDSGTSPRDAVLRLAGQPDLAGMPGAAGAIIVSATRWLCPEHEPGIAAEFG